MSSLDSQFGKQPERFRATRIVFLGEQDGPSERELKKRLDTLFTEERSVFRAYLARISYGNSSDTSVALCLRVKAAPDKDLVERVGKVFASMFGWEEHLDAVFLSSSQESDLAKYCRPFFSAAR